MKLRSNKQVKCSYGDYESNRDYVLSLVEEGLIDPNDALLCCLKYMSEDDVGDMIEYNGLDEYLFTED